MHWSARAAVLWLALGIGAARAGPVLDHVQSGGTLSCAAEPRPGFADTDDEGRPTGLAFELCRAVAIAVIGPQAKVRLVLPETDAAFTQLAAGGADLSFLSGGTLSEHHLTGALIPGPAVFLDSVGLMVPESAKATGPADLAGQTICMMIGSAGQRAVEDRLGQTGLIRLTFREDVEMLDAYNVGRCDAVGDDTTRLDEMRKTGGINRLRSRLLQPPLTLTPIVAATPINDGAWASLVFWVLNSLIDDSRPKSSWRGTLALTIPGLRPGWREDIRSNLGSYADMRGRTLPPDTARPNAPWPLGLLTPPGAD